jgi:UDP-glucose:(heptosyl)LPS alpha-1,3-glucosyltransferase
MTKPEFGITLIKSELFKQGGLEKYTWQIAKDFCLRGVPVTLLTSGTVQPPFSDPHLKVISLPVSHSLSFLNVMHFDKACSAFLNQHPTSIVFSLDRNRFQTHLRAGNGVHAAYLQHRCREEGVVKRASFALNPLHRMILSLEKKAFEHPELRVLFANSALVKQEILKFYATDPAKIHVIHNGVEWQAMQGAFDAWEYQKEKRLLELGLNATAFQFLFIGHNFRRKGLEKLLRALGRIKQEHFQLSVIGKDKKLDEFLELTDKLGLKEKVLYFGSQKDPLPFYQIADCCVIPSLYDPFANVTVESLAMGVPVISSKHNGGHEILTPENGVVVDSLDDADAFSEVLRSAIGRPKTRDSAGSIRRSVKHLDFSNQLRLITEATLYFPQSPSVL